MRSQRSHRVGSGAPGVGFTLIEVLVVIAVISLLLAVILPALEIARAAGRRVVCASQLRQITFGWYAYLGDNNQRFLKAVNAGYEFGGWRGIADAAVRRPLNRYVGLPTEPKGEDEAKLFRCPADGGDDDYGPSAYLYFGNSYQANLLLIGPDSFPAKGLAEPICTLNGAINEHLKDLKADAVGDPSRLLLVGDHNWVTQWQPRIPVGFGGRTWHGRQDRYNLAFFDGHAAPVNIQKGVYLASEYRIQPFKELDSLTCEMQSRIVREVCGAR